MSPPQTTSEPPGQQPQTGPVLGRILELPMVVASLGILALLAFTFAGRVAFPYDLEWMEGGMLVHAWRVMHGKALYVTPGPEFIPYIYPPLYAWLLAALGWVVGLGYPLGRTVSLLGTLGAAAAAGAAVRGERGSWALALATGALFLSGYDETGSFYDLVRIDGLLMALLGWSLVAVRHGWLRAGGILLVLAFATKHNAAIFGLPMLLWLWGARGRGDALRFAAWSVVPALAFTLAMLSEGDGLFLTYLLAVPATHPFVPDRFFPGSFNEMFGGLPIALGLGLLAAAVGLRRPSAGGVFWATQGALALLFAAVMRGHHGGYLNVLVPGIWALAVWGGVGLASLQARWRHPAVLGIGSLLLATQLWQGRWDPGRYLPTKADRDAGDELVAEMAAIDGEVFSPHAPWYPVLAGKQPSFPLIALWDVDHPGGPLHEHVDTFDAALASGEHWGAVVLAKQGFRHRLDEGYEAAGQVRHGSSSALYPKTGWKVRPRYLYLRRKDLPATPAD